MKRISLITGMLVLAGAVYAQEPTDILRAREYTDIFHDTDTTERAGLRPGSVTLSAGEMADLRRAPVDEPIHLPSLDELRGDSAEPLRYRRTELFAPGALTRHVSQSGSVMVKPERRLFYLAMNATTGIGLAVDPKTGHITGFAASDGQKMKISSTGGAKLSVAAVESLVEGSDTCDTRVGDQPHFDLANATANTARSQSAATAGSGISYEAVVAIDTDNEWMAGKGNDVDTAMTFITDLFLAMNVFYERDMETRLKIGDVILRTTTDPYSVASDRSDQLDEFAEYWRLNMGGVDRDFATMFSGRDIDTYYYSGIAWLDQFCENGYVARGGRTVGSYSFNAIGSGRTAANTAKLVGHELGHNMGSPHTHCYNPAVDQCFGGESGCWSGSVSCPAGGKGTIMSYCHYSTQVGGAGCGSSKSEFHPTVQGLVKDRLAANSPACISLFVEEPPPETPFFNSGFE